MHDALLNIYNLKKGRIKERLSDFTEFYNKPVSWFFEDNEMVLKQVDRKDNERIFEELVFCILTANGSAKSAMKAVDFTRDILITGDSNEIQKRLKSSGVRFHNRAGYIVENRNKKIDFKKIIGSYDNPKETREFFVGEVKGLGYKEASHFLRNIGVFGLAILDKHVINSLFEYGIINETPKSLNRNKYLEIEQKYIGFAEKLGINMDELDLLLWSIKNGEIMK